MAIDIKRPARLSGMAGIGVDRMGALADAAGRRDLLRFENLDTDVPPPKVAVRITAEAARNDDDNSYLPFVGRAGLRRAVAQHVGKLAGIAYDESQVLISAGGLSGILNVLLALVDTGDEVVLTDPTYSGLINRVRLAGGVPRLAPLVPAPEGWTLDRDALRRAVSGRTRLLLLMSPAMPSGAVLERDDWRAVAEVADAANLILVYDAAMEHILYDGRRPVHPAAIDGLAERTITVGAASKELRMIGWRVGWIVAPRPFIPDLALVNLSNVVVPVGIAQRAVAAALALPEDDVRSAVAEWERRRDALLDELAGLPVVKPGGGWSMLLHTAALGLSGAEASRQLFERASVATTPMDGWGERHGAGWLRFVFANEPVERIRGCGQCIRAALGSA
jgi:aspartate/methionine/tyrosine aminotransferase